MLGILTGGGDLHITFPRLRVGRGRLLGESRAICSHVKISYSQRGMSFFRIRLTRVYGWVGVGHPSSSVIMGMDNVSVVYMGLPDQILGPPRRLRSVAMSVAMLQAIIEGHGGLPLRWVRNANSSGHCLNFVAA